MTAHRYVSVLTRARPKEVRAYLYGNVQILASLPGGRYVLEVTAANDRRAMVTAVDQSARLASGLHGAVPHETFGDALAHLPASRNPVPASPRRDPEADGRFAQEWAEMER